MSPGFREKPYLKGVGREYLKQILQPSFGPWAFTGSPHTYVFLKATTRSWVFNSWGKPCLVDRHSETEEHSLSSGPCLV